MTPDQIEEQLLETMSGSHLRSPSAGRLPDLDPKTIAAADLAAVGLDTNVLKQLGRDTFFASRLITTLDKNAVSLIIPAQSVIEFWNRYQTFAAEDANRLSGEVAKLKGLLVKMGGLSLAEGRLDTMQEIVDDIALELKEATTVEYLEKSRLMMELILRDAVQPMVSRSKFNSIAISRQGCKVPPGFADEAKKGAAGLGDFYVWCDFLMGAMTDPNPTNQAGLFVFVTDDAKPDWKTGRTSHPELTYEFERLTGKKLMVSSFAEFRQIIERSASGAETGTADESEL